MVPKVNGRGHSFNGIMAYLCHDKGADTGERVVWHEVGNLATNDPVKAAKIMAWTDCNAFLLKQEANGSAAGRHSEAGAVYHYSLSWAQGEAPDPEHQREQVAATLERLGLQNHQYVAVAHDDTDHAHVHVVVNLTDSETGKRNTPSFDKREMQAWALEYEREHGVYCEQREINAQRREQGELVKYRDEKQHYSVEITRAYHAADNGKAFVNALQAEGLELAAARRGNGFLVIDGKGDIQKLARQLDIDEKGKAKTAAINALLADIDRDNLPDADQLAAEIKEQSRRAEEASIEVESVTFEHDDIADDTQTLDQPAEIEEAEALPPLEAAIETGAAAQSLEQDENQAQSEPVSTWELLHEHIDMLPDAPPEEVPQVLPHECPPLVTETHPSDRNKGIHEQLAAFAGWMQDKVVAAYEYVAQRLLQQQDNEHNNDRGFR